MLRSVSTSCILQEDLRKKVNAYIMSGDLLSFPNYPEFEWHPLKKKVHLTFSLKSKVFMFVNHTATDDHTSTPTMDPSSTPTENPSSTTTDPTNDPTSNPSLDPTQNVTWATAIPTTSSPTTDPSNGPTVTPTEAPTVDSATGTSLSDFVREL